MVWLSFPNSLLKPRTKEINFDGLGFSLLYFIGFMEGRLRGQKLCVPVHDLFVRQREGYRRFNPSPRSQDRKASTGDGRGGGVWCGSRVEIEVGRSSVSRVCRLPLPPSCNVEPSESMDFSS